MRTFTVVIHDDTTGTINDDCLDGQHADAFLGEYVLAMHTTRMVFRLSITVT